MRKALLAGGPAHWALPGAAAARTKPVDSPTGAGEDAEHEMTPPTARFGPFALHACGTLRAAGQVVLLTPKEEAVLRLLVQGGGRRIGRDELLENAWPGLFASDASLARCIHTLRRKLAEAGGGDCIRTCYGRGYQLTVEVCVTGEPSVGTRRPASLELTPGL